MCLKKFRETKYWSLKLLKTNKQIHLLYKEFLKHSVIVLWVNCWLGLTNHFKFLQTPKRPKSDKINK